MIAGVISSYEKFLKNNYQKNTSDTIKLFTKARDELNKDLERMEREYLEYRQKNPSYTADEGGGSFTSRRLEQLEQAVNQAMVRSLQLRSQLELGRKLLGEGVDAAAVVAALSRLGSLTGDLGPRRRRTKGAAPAAGAVPRAARGPARRRGGPADDGREAARTPPGGPRRRRRRRGRGAEDGRPGLRGRAGDRRTPREIAAGAAPVQPGQAAGAGAGDPSVVGRA